MKSAFDANKVQVPVTVFYNSDHAESSVEVDYLISKNNGNLIFVDVSTDSESATQANLTVADIDHKVFAKDANGLVLSGVDALYLAHHVIGLGSYFRMGRLPGFSSEGTGIGPRT